MPQVIKESTGNQTATLTVMLERKDYEPRFNSELNRFRGKAQLKGFRKGKTPTSFVKKMYGEAILVDIINDMVNKGITDFVEQEKLDIIGYPIPAKDQAKLDLDVNNFKDYSLKFEIGFHPDFELQGLTKDDLIEWYDVEVKAKWVDDEIERMQRWGGKQEPIDGPVQEGDIMDIKGKESDNPNGLETTFKLYFNALTAEAKKQFDGRKKGDLLTADIFNLEEGVDEDYVRKYLLNLEEGDDRPVGQKFELTITEITRTTLAEVTEELIKNYLGEGKASNLEEARAYFKKDIQKAYDDQSDNLFFGQMLDYLFEKNPIELPESFLKKWLKHNSEKLTDQDIEKNYKDYEESLKRRILVKKITEKFDLRITEEEVIDRLKISLRNNYFGPQADDAMLSAMVKNMQSDKKYSDIFDRNADEILSDKMKDVMKTAVTLKPVSINEEQFRELLKKTNKKYEAIDKVEERLDLNAAAEEEED